MNRARCNKMQQGTETIPPYSPRWHCRVWGVGGQNAQGTGAKSTKRIDTHRNGSKCWICPSIWHVWHVSMLQQTNFLALMKTSRSDSFCFGSTEFPQKSKSLSILFQVVNDVKCYLESLQPIIISNPSSRFVFWSCDWGPKLDYVSNLPFDASWTQHGVYKKFIWGLLTVFLSKAVNGSDETTQKLKHLMQVLSDAIKGVQLLRYPQQIGDLQSASKSTQAVHTMSEFMTAIKNVKRSKCCA